MDNLDDEAMIPVGGPELLEELDLGSARGGRRPSAGPVQIDVVRKMTEADLDQLSTPAQALAVAPLEALRSSHHQLAQLIARGMSQAEAGLVTGYSGSYISILVNRDPAFRELLEHYRRERAEVFVDALQRVKLLGLEANDLLLDRLRNEPEKWTNQQLMDLHKETLGALARPGGGGASAGAGPVIGSLNVSFVSPEREREPSAGPTFDMEAVVVEAEDE